MNKGELKKILKPLIKECIKEVIFEEGILSEIISEVLRSTSENIVLETKQPQQEETQRKYLKDARTKKLDETRSKMIEAMGNDAYAGVFEGTTPLSSGGSTTQSESTPAASNPLSSYAPADAGVNINGLLSIAGDKWSKLRG